jgi:ABC-type branched-subunit amino acid transport system ATPase component
MTLQAQGIGVRFDGAVALDNVDVTVRPGQVLALVGPNGSGKSTLFNAITGFVNLYSGRVLVDGHDVSTRAADSRIRFGIARTFQTPRIDPELSMIDSILCGFLPSLRSALIPSLLGGPGIVAGERQARAAAIELMEMFGLAHYAQVPMGELPLGSVRMADVLRAMAMRPRYLLLDEPAAGLSHAEQQHLSAGIRAIAARNVGILLVEHNFSLVRDIADELVVLDGGQVLAAGDPNEVATNPAVIETYLGSSMQDHSSKAERTPTDDAGDVLRASNVTVSYGKAQVCHKVDLSVRRGEITAILGPNGAGKSSLMMALAGIRLDNRRWSGEVMLDNQDITDLPAERRPAARLAFVPERRGNIFPGMTVQENLDLALRGVPTADRGDMLNTVTRLFPVLDALSDTQSGLLSGGEQQMLAIAMALCVRPTVLLLDEPTQGLAPAILDDLIEAFLALRDDGLAILVTEQNQGFAAALADRFLVLSHGEVVTSGDHDDLKDRDFIAGAYL